MKSHILKKECGKWGGRFVIPENNISKMWNKLADIIGERHTDKLGDPIVSFPKDYKVESLGWLLDRFICNVISKRKATAKR